MENWRSKNGSIPSKKEKEESILKFVRDKQTDAQTDKVNDKK